MTLPTTAGMAGNPLQPKKKDGSSAVPVALDLLEFPGCPSGTEQKTERLHDRGNLDGTSAVVTDWPKRITAVPLYGRSGRAIFWAEEKKAAASRMFAKYKNILGWRRRRRGNICDAK